MSRPGVARHGAAGARRRMFAGVVFALSVASVLSVALAATPDSASADLRSMSPAAPAPAAAAVHEAGTRGRASRPTSVHDDLESADPGDGDTLAVVPDTLRLGFTRAQNLDLASVRLLGPRGEVALAPLLQAPEMPAVVLVPVSGRWSVGAYTVLWRVVGQDGHPVSGEYMFVVEDGAQGLPTTPDVAPSEDGVLEPAAVEPRIRDEPRFGIRSAPYILVRWLGFAALLGVLGTASWSLLVLPVAHRRDGIVDVEVERARAGRVGMWSAAALALVGLARFGAQAAALDGGGAVEGVSVAGAMLTSTVWGVGWWLQLIGSLCVLGALMWARAGTGRIAWLVAGGAALALAVTPALSGHAVGVEGVGVFAVVADALHVLSAGGWMGGLLLLLVAGVRPAMAEGADRRRIVALVEGFSLTALGFAAVLVGTGVFSAWLHLGSVGALWTSSYGRALGLKLALLLPLLATGAYNWLRVRPALARVEDGVGRLRRSGRMELGVAIAVLLATAVLVATPPPMESGGPDSVEVPSSTPEQATS